MKMHIRLRAALFGMAGALVLLACQRPNDDLSADFDEIPSATVPIPRRSPPSDTATATASATGSTLAPPASASASGSAPVGSASGSGSAGANKPPAKVYECGEKGKPDCPMQKWMKGVAGGAVASGDADRMARAFQGMSRAPSGMGGWSGIVATGIAKAQAGDFDGAKAQCKACHSKYQSSYHANQRDLKWP
jgi:hypothetical protein